MKILSTFLFYASLSLLVTNCVWNDDCTKAKGNTVTEERTVTDFNKVAHTGSGNVYLTQGEQYKVTVSAKENIIHLVKTTVTDGELEIYLDNCIRGSSDLNVFVTMPSLQEIELSGSGNMKGEGTWSVESLGISVTGSGDINFQAETSSVIAQVTGSGDIDISGSTEYLESFVTGSGDIHAFGLNAQRTLAKVQGSGDIETSVSNDLEVQITGSGTVLYKGSPSIQQHITGSGDLVQVN